MFLVFSLVVLNVSSSLFAKGERRWYNVPKKVVFMALLELSTPSIASIDAILERDYYTSCYSYDDESPVIVSYDLTREMLSGKSIKKRMSFRIDKDIPREFASSNNDYKNSGFDRGHIASDASFDKNASMLRETYLYSNVTPMARRVNRYYWSKAERYERYLAVKLGEIRVINLIKFSDNPQKLKDSNVSIPDGFYKIIIAKGFQRCLYYKNTNAKVKDRLKNHMIECDEVDF